jgi:hypothetical protein
MRRLQQVPVRIETREGALASLVELPENDEWWTQVIESVDYTHTFALSSIAAISWAIIAFLFTVIESFTGTIEQRTLGAIGQGVDSVYLSLLSVVIGRPVSIVSCSLSHPPQVGYRSARSATRHGCIMPSTARTIRHTLPPSMANLFWQVKR